MTGTYEHNLDPKNRISVPGRLRDAIGESFHLSMGADPCLTIYPKAAWDALCLRAEELEEEEDREAMEVFFSQTYRCTLDSQGRFVIPPKLREFAQLEREVVIVGANTVARIWSAQLWAERTAAYMNPQKMKSLARKIRL